MCPKSGYQFFDHTADIGIRAEGETLQVLFVAMAQGLMELIVEDSKIEPQEVRRIELSADSTESLLLAWLKELLFWFSTDRFLPLRYEIEEITLTTLRGQLHGEEFDPSRHVQGREVKAITRHLLEVRNVDGAWQAQVIVDL